MKGRLRAIFYWGKKKKDVRNMLLATFNKTLIN